MRRFVGPLDYENLDYDEYFGLGTFARGNRQSKTAPGNDKIRKITDKFKDWCIKYLGLIFIKMTIFNFKSSETCKSQSKNKHLLKHGNRWRKRLNNLNKKSCSRNFKESQDVPVNPYAGG